MAFLKRRIGIIAVCSGAILLIILAAAMHVVSRVGEECKFQDAISTSIPHGWQGWAQETLDFTNFAHRCTDKTTSHRYASLYARILFPFRYSETGRGDSTEPASGQQPAQQRKLRMLEMGLGCNMANCVAGGFRLFRNYLPRVEYFALEYNFSLCEERFGESNITVEEAAYLRDHVCRDDTDLLTRCGDQFGPFDIIIDDASHQQQDMITALSFLFPSEMAVCTSLKTCRRHISI